MDAGIVHVTILHVTHLTTPNCH